MILRKYDFSEELILSVLIPLVCSSKWKEEEDMALK